MIAAHEKKRRLQRALKSLGCILVFVLVPSACKPPKVDLSTAVREYEPHQYREIWRRWTRSDRSFEDILVNIRAFATYWSHDFCYAYTAKYVDTFGMGPKRAAEFQKVLLTERTEYHEFKVSVVTQDPEWNDLAEKNSIWRVSLASDKGTEIEPFDVRRISRITSTHKTFFPQIDLFHELYRIRFPRTLNGKPVIPEDTSFFVLRISGPKGRLSLKWEIKGQ